MHTRAHLERPVRRVVVVSASLLLAWMRALSVEVWPSPLNVVAYLTCRKAARVATCRTALSRPRRARSTLRPHKQENTPHEADPLVPRRYRAHRRRGLL